jgi:hypothetical protein
VKDVVHAAIRADYRPVWLSQGSTELPTTGNADAARRT